jgi:hypothetical protein
MSCTVENQSSIRVFATNKLDNTTHVIKCGEKLQFAVNTTELSIHGEILPVDKEGICIISGDDDGVKVEYSYDHDNDPTTPDLVLTTGIDLQVAKVEHKKKLDQPESVFATINSLIYNFDKDFKEHKKAYGFDLNAHSFHKKPHWLEEWVAGHCSAAVYGSEGSFLNRYKEDPVLKQVEYLGGGGQPLNQRYFDHTRWGIYYDHDFTSLFVAFRGTNATDDNNPQDNTKANFIDCLTDASAIPTVFPMTEKLKEKFRSPPRKVGIHSGFYSSLIYNLPEILTSIETALQTLQEANKKVEQIILSGHSLGGALANTLNTLIFLDQLPTRWPFNYPIHAITFASPHVLYFEPLDPANVVYDVLPTIPAVNFVHNYDIVPQVTALVYSDKYIDTVVDMNVGKGLRAILDNSNFGKDVMKTVSRTLNFTYHYILLGETYHFFTQYRKKNFFDNSGENTTDALGVLDYSKCYTRTATAANEWFRIHAPTGSSVGSTSLDDHSMYGYLDSMYYVITH